MNKSLKILIATLLALPFAASADWRLTMAPAWVQVDFSAPGILELRIKNTGDSVSPAQSVYSQGKRFVSVDMHYEVTPLSGGCRNWHTFSNGFLFQVASQFSIPEVLPQTELRCQFSFVARGTGVISFEERFEYFTNINSLLRLGTIKIGGLTDLGATVNLISTRQVNAQSVNRYRLNVQNFGQFPIQLYGFGACEEIPLNFTVAINFPGSCSPSNLPSNCNDKLLFDLTAGPIQPGNLESCEFETIGNANPDLRAIGLFSEITRPAPDDRLLLDINPENDSLRLVLVDPFEVPTISWLGLVGLIFGVVLVARRTI